MKSNKLSGGFAPFMFGLLLATATVSVITEKQLISGQNQYQREYITDHQKYLQNKASNLQYTLLNDDGSHKTTISLLDLNKHIYTNAFNSVNSAVLGAESGGVGNRKIALIAENNKNIKSDLLSGSALTKLKANSQAGFIDEEDIKLKQQEISYKQLKKQLHKIYEDILKSGKSTLPCGISSSYKDAWGKKFNYKATNGFSAQLSFTSAWGQKMAVPIELPAQKEKDKVKDVKNAWYNLYYDGGHNKFYRTYVLTQKGKVIEFAHTRSGRWELSNLPPIKQLISTDRSSIGNDRRNYGSNVFAIAENGDLYRNSFSYGVSEFNSWGPVGFIKVSGVNNVKKIVFGDNGSSYYVITTDDRLYTFGHNRSNMLGRPECERDYYGNRNCRVEMSTLSGVKDLIATSSSAYVLTNRGDVWLAGYGYKQGSVGDGVWRKLDITNVKQIVYFNFKIMALKDNGELWSQGDFYASPRMYSKCSISSSSGWKLLKSGVKQIVDNRYKGRYVYKEETPYRVYAIMNDNSVYMVGQGSYDSNFTCSFAKYNSSSNIKKIYTNGYGSHFLTYNNETYSESNRMTGKQEDVAGAKKIVEGRGRFLLLKNNGDVWIYGSNYHGELGLGDKNDRIYWTKTSLSNISDIIVPSNLAQQSFYAVDASGDLWAVDFEFNFAYEYLDDAFFPGATYIWKKVDLDSFLESSSSCR